MDQIFIRDREIATKEYVDNRFENIDVPVTENMATKEYVDSKIEDMEAVTETMATKTYVDEKIDNANVIAGQGITNIVQLTQAEYEALSEKDGQTLYLIMG